MTERSPISPALTSLEILSALSHALNHQIRTPLSVISNDLFYLQSLVPSGECDRALNRCRDISAVLQSVSINAETLAQRDVVDFASVLKLPEVKAERLMVRGSPVLFEQLGKLLSALLGKAGNGGASFVVAKVEATEQLSFVQLSFAQLSFRCSVPAEFPAIESSSFTRLFFAAAPIDAVEPMLIDALVDHLGGALSLCLKGGILRGDLRFPLEGA